MISERFYDAYIGMHEYFLFTQIHIAVKIFPDETITFFSRENFRTGPGPQKFLNLRPCQQKSGNFETSGS